MVGVLLGQWLSYTGYCSKRLRTHRIAYKAGFRRALAVVCDGKQ
jgi:hypothetical protein